MSTTVEVRPIPDEKKWHNKKGKDSFTQPKTIEALYDSATGHYATGLTAEEAKKYGGELGVDLSDTFNPNEPHVFWSSKAANVVLQNHTMLFDTAKPIEFVKVKLMKASKFVANSLKQWEAGEYPDATHIIFDEGEEVSLKAQKIQAATKAVVIASKMSKDDKISMIQILSDKGYKGKTDDFIDVEIDSIIKEKPNEFIRFSNMGREDVHLRASVLEMIQKNILTKEGSSVYYMGEIIGYTYEEAVAFFKNPQNQRMKVAILEKLNK